MDSKRERLKSGLGQLIKHKKRRWEDEPDSLNGLRVEDSTELGCHAPSGGARSSGMSLTVGSEGGAEIKDTAKPEEASEEDFTVPAKLPLKRPPPRVSIETQNASNNPFSLLSATPGSTTQHPPPEKATASHQAYLPVSRGQTKRMRRDRGRYRNASPPRGQNTPFRDRSGAKGQSVPHKAPQAAKPQTTSNQSAPSSVMTATAKPPTFATPAGPSNAPPPRKQIGVTEIFKQLIYESPSASAPSTKTPKPAEVKSPPQKRTVTQDLSALYGFDDTDEEEEAEKEAREARRASVLQRIAQDSEEPAPLESMTPGVDGDS